MTDKPRLIEVAFPLKQASLDSVHEKNVRHGHISTLHIWPARRPLAACRAALIATLLPDPGNKEERQKLVERIGGKVTTVKKKKTLPSGRTEEQDVEETVGGVLHWGRESSPDMEWFRQEIKKAYGGRAPKVLDPFSGGGAIPLEAMRLGCEVTAMDINPVAWFILKCTLEYPQKLAGQYRPLPAFALKSREFMEDYLTKGSPKKPTKKQLERDLDLVQSELFPPPDADLSWHVRAWGWWVLQQARKELAQYYPTYADYQTLAKGAKSAEGKEPKLVPLKDDGTLDLKKLNAEFTQEYLSDPNNPRWVPKPTVAYLWARTVKCKNCRATIPLLKTRWLGKKDKERVVLSVVPNVERTGVKFGIQRNASVMGGNSAQRREHDKLLGKGTMSRAGAQCPCCPAIMTMDDIRHEARAKRMGDVMTAVIAEGDGGKEYRLPFANEVKTGVISDESLERVYASVPYGLPNEPTPAGGGSGAGRAFSIQGYGLMKWKDLFTSRQLLTIGVFIKTLQSLPHRFSESGYPPDWSESVSALLVMALDRLVNYMSTICIWEPVASEIKQTFLRFALPITWDFAEANPFSGADRYFAGGVSAVQRVLLSSLCLPPDLCSPVVTKKSAILPVQGTYDAIITDPPYYDAIPYSDLMDFFYVWIRRAVAALTPSIDEAFSLPQSPKWDRGTEDGELIDDSSRHENDSVKSKMAYERGMAQSFISCHKALSENGRLLVVFANKQPKAWEALASALIQSGFVVDGSWPIVTEMRGGVRNHGRASLASSIWLVCKKRPESARAGWDNKVLDEMREKIVDQLRDFWDAGIRGPDFVWAATGPALEAYSKHPVVKKANEPNQVMSVTEFLKHVRRMVVDFVVGRVLAEAGGEAMTGLDDVTTYYLLHRHDFRLNDAPIGACILYAVSCGLSDKALADQYDLLLRTGGNEPKEEDEEEIEDEASEEPEEEGSGSTVKLKSWNQRKKKTLGYEAPGGISVPFIDQVHRLMHVWREGEEAKVNEYLDARGLRRNALFHQLLQALIELAEAGSEERSLLESISNHIKSRGATAPQMAELPGMPSKNSE